MTTEPHTRDNGSRIEPYSPTEIEPRWQARWEELGLHRTDLDDDSRPRFYLLTMYDYPSGDLHIGHWFTKTPTDAISRFRRMRGYNVFFPVGFDAFGLPAENAAARKGVHPRDWTLSNIANMRRQLRSMGATWDWDAEVVTCEPEYYRWNQWFFLKFLEAGLAYRQMAPVDWCPKDQVVLAREQVEGANRVCWRCSTPVTKRDLEQWFFRTTKYADELLTYSEIKFPDPIRLMQTNWIGRSEGAEIAFGVAPDEHQPGGDEIRVFTTRPDTLFGATFMVLAPEHPLVDRLTEPGRRAEVDEYRFEARRKSEIDRMSTEREKTGVALGARAVNPINGEQIPIWIADYVLLGYGTGAIMAVPGARRARLRVRPAARPAHPPGGRATRCGRWRNGRGVRGPQRRRGASQLGRFLGPGRAGGRPAHHRPAGAVGQRQVGGHISVARLADQPPACLGHTHPGRLLPVRPVVRHRARATGSTAGAAARGFRVPAAGRQPARVRRALPEHHLSRAAAEPAGARPTPWTPSSTRPGIGGATSRRTRRMARSTASVRSCGARSSSTPAAPSTP